LIKQALNFYGRSTIKFRDRSRLQHTQMGPGVVVGVRYATYLISFINHGIKEIDKTDSKLEENYT
jgi:hypothetical protein